jgi:predicted RNA-binding Zn-ribbon protein involved in translation (DUF1610 family)
MTESLARGIGDCGGCGKTVNRSVNHRCPYCGEDLFET